MVEVSMTYVNETVEVLAINRLLFKLVAEG
jgi:hypothetical protein